MKTKNSTSLFNSENPFLNELIVSHVFLFGKGKWASSDLKSFRLVCKLWCGASFQLWRSTAVLSLYQRRNTRQQQKLSGLPVSEFLVYCDDSTDPFKLLSMPFSHIRLVNWHIRTKREENKPGEKEVFEKLSLVAEHLHLYQCTFHWTAFHELVFEKLPNMKELRLTESKLNWDIYWCGNWQYASPILLDATSPAEKMKTLEITGIVPFPWDNDRLLPKCPNLKVYNAEFEGGKTILQILPTNLI